MHAAAVIQFPGVEASTPAVESAQIVSPATPQATAKDTCLLPPGREEALRRWRLLRDVVAAMAQGGISQAEACRHLGLSQATVSRWMDRVDGLDLANTLHRDAILDALEPGRSTGRPCRWEILLELEPVREVLRRLYLATVGASSDAASSGRRTAKVATTLLRFAEEPECPHDLALLLRRGYQPIAFVRFLRQVTPELEARLRGEKHFGLHGVGSRRDMTVRLADGRRGDLPAGFLWELDDMSSNQPFYTDGPDGPLISRQGLYARDVKSGRWLGVELVARPREAYRAEDILRFLRRMMQIYGKPDMLRLEQGIWRSRAIAGHRVDEVGAVVEEEARRPEMEPEQRQLLQDGLTAIGVEIQWATSAHRKGGIESAFNYLQTVLATYTTDAINIGRHAGEFEHGAKQLRRVRAGSHHPGELGFAPIGDLANRIERAFAFVNGKLMERLGSTPDDVWARDTGARPLPPLAQDDLAVFLPDTRETTIRGGLITVTVDGVPIDFRADRLIELGTGYRVYARFDATEPALGAAIYNRETSSANHQGYRSGQLICWAAFEVPGPQAVVSVPDPRGIDAQTVQERYGVDADAGRAGRRAQLRLARTEFRALPRPGQPAVRAATARDGRGNVAEATRNLGTATQPKSQNTTPPSPRSGVATYPASHPPTDRTSMRSASDPLLSSDRSGRRHDSIEIEPEMTETISRRITTDEETVEYVETARLDQVDEQPDEIERL